MHSISKSNNNRNRGLRAATCGTLIALLALIGTTATAADGDATRGKDKSVTCAACHGADGNSINPEWPSLAGQHQSYLVTSMLSFQEGARENVLMSPQAANLTDEDIADLAAYFSTQSPKRLTADPALISQGERLYRGGNREKSISACIACHGPSGRGNPRAGYPSLAGQHGTYTANQLLAYRGEARRSDSSVGQVMRNISALMSDDEIKAVSSYIQGLQ